MTLTLQEQSDFLAEKLLGWKKYNVGGPGGYWWNRGNDKVGLHNEDWFPHLNAEQCLQYLAPKLISRGLEIVIWVNERNNIVQIVDGKTEDYLADVSDKDSVSTAFVQAAYEAIVEAQ